MARIKNPNSGVKRRTVAIPLMLVSVCIVLLVIFYLLDFRSQGVGIFQTRLDKVTNEFETVETNYNNAVSSILTERAPVPDFTISVIKESYQNLASDLADLESTIAAPASLNSLKEVVAKREATMLTLQTMNQTLRIEEETGNSLSAYNTCKKNISYRQKASQIIAKLRECEAELNAAVLAATRFPKESLVRCTATKTPMYYMQQTVSSHELFISSYTYTSKGKAKEAAATDLAYQKTLKEIQRLGDWNSCITNYLEQTAKTILD